MVVSWEICLADRKADEMVAEMVGDWVGGMVDLLVVEKVV